MANQDVIVLDAKTRCNRNPYFLPLAQTLQGEVSTMEYHSDKIPGQIAGLPGGALPGERMTFNAKTGEWRIEHKLDMPEFETIAKAVRNSARRLYVQNPTGRQREWGRFSELRRGVANADKIPTWLYWIRIMVDTRKFEVVSGDIPAMQKIRAMGDINISSDPGRFGDSNKAREQTTLPKLELATSGSNSGGGNRN